MHSLTSPGDDWQVKRAGGPAQAPNVSSSEAIVAAVTSQDEFRFDVVSVSGKVLKPNVYSALSISVSTE